MAASNSGLGRMIRSPYVALPLAAALVTILIVLWAILQSDPLEVREVFLVFFAAIPILAIAGLLALRRSSDRARGWLASGVRWAVTSACAMVVALVVYGLGWTMVLSHLQSVKTEFSEYNYAHFSYGIYALSPPKSKVHAGMPAIDETIYDLSGKPMQLSALWKDKPIVLEFGSVT